MQKDQARPPHSPSPLALHKICKTSTSSTGTGFRNRGVSPRCLPDSLSTLATPNPSSREWKATHPEGTGRASALAPGPLADCLAKYSIAVNGCCPPGVDITGEIFAADLSGETLRRTSLGEMKPGTRVNLERPLTAMKELGGHFVQGHVDGVGRVSAPQNPKVQTGGSAQAFEANSQERRRDERPDLARRHQPHCCYMARRHGRHRDHPFLRRP